MPDTYDDDLTIGAIGVPLSKEKQLIRARHKLAIPSSDTGTYYKDFPSVTPDAATSTVTIPDLEEIFWTNPVVNKAITIKANRIIGNGFELLPSDDPNAAPEIAEQAKKDCERFLRKIDYVTFFRQSIINACVAGNEWTELIWNRVEPKSLLYVNHGDFRTIDYRRNFLNNKVVVGNDGKPAGYWQYIENLSELYTSISLLFGSKENYENLQHAKERLLETQSYVVYDENGNEIAVIMKKPNYMFLNQNEIVPLTFNNLNDNYFGTSDIIPAYNAVKHLDQVMFAVAEAINDMGYPKPIVTVGDERHAVTETLMDQGADAVLDPVRKESFVLPYYMKMEYASPNTGVAGRITDYPEWFITAVSIGLHVPKELLIGDGGSNRATALQNASDFEKDIEARRRVLEEYIYKIFSYFLDGRGYKNTDGTRNTYVPKIKWERLISEDEALKEKMILEKWDKGLLTFNETRIALGLNEVEDMELGDSYVRDINKPPELPANPMPINNAINQAKEAETHEPGQLITAEHRLQPKEILNKKLNKAEGTKGVDYRKIIYEAMSKKLKTVNPVKARRIRDSIVLAKINKTSKPTVEKHVEKITGLEPYEAKRIVRTEGAILDRNAEFEDARKEGAKFKKYKAVLDGSTSELCRALHGQIRKIDEDFEADYTDSTGKKVHWKGSVPPSHPNCRSVVKYGKTRRI